MTARKRQTCRWNEVERAVEIRSGVRCAAIFAIDVGSPCRLTVALALSLSVIRRQSRPPHAVPGPSMCRAPRAALETATVTAPARSAIARAAANLRLGDEGI